MPTTETTNASQFDTEATEPSQDPKKPQATRQSLVLKAPSQEGDAQAWLALYGDLMTTLMIFFVLLFSMSSIDAGKYKQLKNSLKEVLRAGSAQEETLDVKEQEFDKLEAVLNAYIEQESLEDYILIDRKEEELGIIVDAPIFFNIGDSELLKPSHLFLDIIVKSLQAVDLNVMVEGHTDNLPISTERFKNNWELSTSRASSVVQYLIEKGSLNPKRLTAAGYSKYRPLVKNDSEKNRSKNRRVEIKIIK